MKRHARMPDLAVVCLTLAITVFPPGSATAMEDGRRQEITPYHPAVAPSPSRGKGSIEKDAVLVLAAGQYDYCVQADSYADNTVDVMFTWTGVTSLGWVSSSVSPPCGTVSPAQAQATHHTPTMKAPNDYWWVLTKYTPCETECSTVTLTAKPALGQSRGKTVHLDERYHVGCGDKEDLVVRTFKRDPNDPTRWIPARDFVEIKVIPPEAGTASPRSGYSALSSDFHNYEFPFTYTPSSYSGRVRVTCVSSRTNLLSYDQNLGILTPSSSWRTVCETFCTEGDSVNYQQVYRMQLSADWRYDFSLYGGDGVGARCDADLYMIDMYDSAGTSLWAVSNLFFWENASTLGSLYERWRPPSDGWYYLHVSGFDSDWYPAPMSYCLAYRGSCGRLLAVAPSDVSATDGTDPAQIVITWSTVIDADEYQVYRATSLDGVKTPLGNWQSGTSYVDSSADGATTYYYWVKARNCAGESPLSSPAAGWHPDQRPPNDTCEKATPVFEDIPNSGSTLGATGAAQSSADCNDVKDVWHSYTPGLTQYVTIRLSRSTFASTLAVYDQCGGTELACTDPRSHLNAEVGLPAVDTETYLIRVGGCAGTTGSYTLNIESGLLSDFDDCNGVNWADFATFAQHWRSRGDPNSAVLGMAASAPGAQPGASGVARCDRNGDGCVDGKDLLGFCRDWSRGLAGIALSTNAVRENQPAGTPVGILSWVGPKDLQSPSRVFTLVPGYRDNALFSIDPVTHELKTAVPLDAEKQKDLWVRVRATDDASPVMSYEKSLRILVTK